MHYIKLSELNINVRALLSRGLQEWGLGVGCMYAVDMAEWKESLV